MKRKHLRKVCGNCGHHTAAHRWTPSNDGMTGPHTCTVCDCPGYRRAERGERVTKLPLTVGKIKD